MGTTEHVLQALVGGAHLVRARVIGVILSGQVHVTTGDGIEWLCDALVTGEATPVYAADDVVLAMPPSDGVRGLVLGRIGRASAADEAPSVDVPPGVVGSTRERRVVIEADEEILLRVGESSIRITRDGKVVIRGQHVLTRAKGTNRIKGGSVAIN